MLHAQTKPLRFTQLSDLHLYCDPNATLLKVNTENSFKAVVDALNPNDIGDLLLLTGDLSQDGSLASYERIAQILQPFQVSIYCLPGNHDNVNLMMQTYKNGNIKYTKHIQLQNWQMILLNSQKTGLPEGLLSEEELQLMSNLLSKYTTQHTLIIFHHPPLLLGSDWLDGSCLKNYDEFWKRIAPYANIRGIVCGHVHQAFETVINEVKVYTTPSTCIQFKPNQSTFTLDHIPPGYRSFSLFSDGRIETTVHRLSHYIGEFDEMSTGY